MATVPACPPTLAVHCPFDKAVNRVADAGTLDYFIDLAAKLS